MATLTLAPQYTWFAPTDTTLKRANIAQIDIVDSYTPNGNETHSWDASEDKDSSVMCYVIGTQLIIAGNGSGKIYANPDCTFVFSEPKGVSNPRDYFSNVTIINGFDIFDVSKTTTFYGLLAGAKKLAAVVGVKNWNTINVTDMTGLFNGCESLTEVNELGKWNTSNVTTLYQTFSSCTALSSIQGLAKWNISNVINLSCTFRKCLSLKSVLPISNWDVSKVEDTHSMFEGNNHVGDMTIEEIDLTKWNTSSLKVCNHMFYGCAKIKELDLNNWDMSKVRNINHMFADCFGLETIKISNWNVSNCYLFHALFNDCMSLEIIDLSGWNTKGAQTFSQMFEGCKSLKKIIGIENFDTSSLDEELVDPDTGDVMGTSSALFEMFSGCNSLEEIDLSSFDTRKCYNFTRIFYSCNNLKTIYVGDLWSTERATVENCYDMFFGAGGIVGEDGTTLDWSKTANEYACIDGANGKKGYLTHINHKSQGVLVDGRYLYRVAKALRNKLGTTDKYLPSEMEEAIKGIGVAQL